MKSRFLTVGVLLLLIGCSNYGLKFKETPQGNQAVPNLDEAGSVHVSVIAITPWNDIKAKLRPEIPVDPKTLKSQAIPSTQAMLDRYLSILQLQASLAPTVEKITSKSTLTTETGKEDLARTETTTELEPGTPRAPTAVTPLVAGSKPAIEASGITSINSSLALRAMASYKQDVEALNAEVDYAASRTGYEPYLMRIQISVMPRRRHLGYDVYSNLSMFAYKGQSDPQTGAPAPRVPTDGTPFVVPLLSSDSIETAERSQSIEALREIGFALDLIKSFGGLGLSANSQRNRQQALQGLDVNSVLTLGRLSDNSLRVRFGAANDPGGGYATHPRTNTISVLVFFPKNADVARVVSKSSWQHVIDGTELRSDGEDYSQRLEPLVKQWASLGLDEKFFREVDEYPFEGHYKTFESMLTEHLRNVCNTVSASQQPELAKSCLGPQHRLLKPQAASERERVTAYIWAHLLSLLPGGRFSTTVLDLPAVDASCPAAGQLGLYSEVESGIAISLRGGSRLGVGTLQAALHLGAVEKAPATASAAGKKAAPGARAMPPPASRPAYGTIASQILVKDDRRSLELAFDTARMIPVQVSSNVELVPLFVELTGCSYTAKTPLPAGWNVTPLWPTSQFYPLTAKIPLKEKEETRDTGAGVSLSVSTDTLLLDTKNFGEKTIIVDLGEKPESQYALKFAGADVISVGPEDNVSMRSDGTYHVKASGPVKVRLRIASNQSVDVELRAISDKGKLGATVKKLTLSARSSKT